MSRPSPQAAVRPEQGNVAADIRFVSIEKLRTSYASLRGAALPARADLSAELPIRVALCASEGGEVYEVLDGFKRLSHWRERGYTVVPIVVEPAVQAAEHKRLLPALSRSRRCRSI